MPSLNLTPDQVSRVICLPGTALIRCTPPAATTESGLIVKPEAAADWEQKNQAIREGVIVTMNRTRKGQLWRPSPSVNNQRISSSRNPHPDIKFGPSWMRDPDTMSLEAGQTVLYLGRQDEADDAYVVVKIGQIVAVKEAWNGQH